MVDIEKWLHKDEWKRYGKNFLVLVSRHTVRQTEESSGCYDAEGVNRWAVYVYFYPDHPKFNKFVGDHMWQDEASLGFHGGCSFFRRHFDSNGKQTSIQVGADYHHDGDWRFTQMATPKDAHPVFQDAEELFNMLNTLAEAAPVDAH